MHSVRNSDVQKHQDMAASDGWVIIPFDENNNSIGLHSKDTENSARLTIRDYFDVIDEKERKCHLCSATIKITAKSYWNLKTHFKSKHFDEWTKLQSAARIAKPKVRFHFELVLSVNKYIFVEFSPFQTASTGIPVKDGPMYLKTDNENIDPDMFDDVGMDSDASFDQSDQTFCFDDGATGNKRAKITHTYVHHSLNASSSKVPSNGIRIADTGAKDEHTTFGDFIAQELRNMKTDEFRRKLRRIIQKCVLDVMEEEDSMLAMATKNKKLKTEN